MEGFAYLDELDHAVEDSYSSVKEESVIQANEGGNGFGDVYSPAESEASGTYEPQKLSARHREMIRLHALGYKGTQIAQILGVTPQNVYNTLNTPLAKSFLQEIEGARDSSVQDVRERLQEFSPLAAEVVLDIVNEGAKESNRLKAALKVLEMTGQKPGDTVTHNHMHLTKEDIESIKSEHAGGPPVIEESGKTEFNETNRELPEHVEEELSDNKEVEIQTNKAENGEHIQANRKND